MYYRLFKGKYLMKKIASSIAFKLLFVVTLFSLIVNIAHGHTNEKDNNTENQQEEPLMKAPKDIQAMFEKLVKVAGPKANTINLWVDKTAVLNAYMDSGNNLVLFTGLLNFSIRDRNDYDMLAGVMAHEIGHNIYNHAKIPFLCSINNAASRNCERAADWYGIQLMHNAGYDCEGDARFYSALIKTFGGATGEGTHPSDAERMNFSKKACSQLKKDGTMPPLYQEKVIKPKPKPSNNDLIVQDPAPIYS